MRLIRQAEELTYKMHYEVDTWYGDRVVTFEKFIDFVKLAEAFEAGGERVTKPQEIKGELERAVKAEIP